MLFKTPHPLLHRVDTPQLLMKVEQDGSGSLAQNVPGYVTSAAVRTRPYAVNEVQCIFRHSVDFICVLC